MRYPYPLFLYAFLLILGGLYAFVAAPAEANKLTAIMIPAVCAAVAVGIGVIWLTRSSSRARAIIGLYGGYVWPLVVAALVAMPAMARSRAMENWPKASSEFQTALQADPTLDDTREKRRAWFRERGSPDHDQTYLITTLWTLVGLSVVTWVVVLAVAPRKP